jgi:heme/copper-type cytochrome/quinol oxidase subunit 3
MKLFKLTFMTLLLGAIFVVAPASTYAEEYQEAEAEAACAEAAEANAAYAALAAGFLLVPSGIVAIRRRRRQK